MHNTRSIRPAWCSCDLSVSLYNLFCDNCLPTKTIFPSSSGVTRVTVTVVTIAFELTGQGAYILPTMVSDKLFSKLHSINFNGFLLFLFYRLL